jgi:hypothetical protein
VGERVNFKHGNCFIQNKPKIKEGAAWLSWLAHQLLILRDRGLIWQQQKIIEILEFLKYSVVVASYRYLFA